MEIVKRTTESYERELEKLRAEVLQLKAENNLLRAQGGARPAMRADDIARAYAGIRLTPAQFAEALGISTTTLNRLIAKGFVVPRLLGSRQFYLVEDVAATMESAKLKPLRKVG